MSIHKSFKKRKRRELRADQLIRELTVPLKTKLRLVVKKTRTELLSLSENLVTKAICVAVFWLQGFQLSFHELGANQLNRKQTAPEILQ